jgi:hypothetical protein
MQEGSSSENKKNKLGSQSLVVSEEDTWTWRSTIAIERTQVSMVMRSESSDLRHLQSNI